MAPGSSICTSRSLVCLPTRAPAAGHPRPPRGARGPRSGVGGSPPARPRLPRERISRPPASRLASRSPTTPSLAASRAVRQTSAAPCPTPPSPITSTANANNLDGATSRHGPPSALYCLARPLLRVVRRHTRRGSCSRAACGRPRVVGSRSCAAAASRALAAHASSMAA